MTDQQLSGDRAMMERCIALSVRSGEEGEYPHVVICREGAEVTNHERGTCNSI